MKKFLSILFVISMLMTTLLTVSVGAKDTASKWDGTVPTADKNYAFGGEGTEASPYLIDSAAELAQLASNVRLDNLDTCYAGKYFKLTVDIDLDNKPWWAIGGMLAATSANSYTYFGGYFDGDYHTISNLTLQTTNSEGTSVNFIGLFGSVSGAGIYNLGIESGSTTITGQGTTGVANFVGVARYGFCMKNCYNKATMNVTPSVATQGTTYAAAYIGWILDANTAMKSTTKPANNDEKGKFTEAEVSDCYNTGNLTVTLSASQTGAQYRVSAFCGTSAGAAPKFVGCYNTGNTTLTDTSGSTNGNRFVGGMFGAFMDKSSATDCHSACNVTATGAANKGLIVSGKVGSISLTNCTYVPMANDSSVNAVGGKADTAYTNVTRVDSISIPVYTNSTFIRVAMTVVGAQHKTADGNYSARFIATVDDYNKYDEIGFVIVADYGNGNVRTYDKHCSQVFTSLLALEDGETVEKTAADYKSNYLMTMTVENIPTQESGNATFAVKAYYIAKGSTTPVYSEIGNFTTQNGKFVLN